MNGPEVLVPISFFAMIVMLVLGVPMVRAIVRRADRQSLQPPSDPMAAERLARIEAAVESIAIEVERISEAQRFTTKLLAERAPNALPGKPEQTP